MKFILTAINAKYIHSNLAIYDLKAYCQQYKEHIELAEYTINHNIEYILADLYRKNPDAVAFSCYIWNIAIVEVLIREIYKVLPDTKIWLGGPEVSYRAEALLKQHPYLQGVMVGEGEQAFLQLMEHYITKNRALCEVQNLVYQDNKGIHKNKQGPLLALSEVPFPYEDMEMFENRIIYYESSRGCPYSCSYCLSSVEKKLRFRNLELVEKELQFFLDRKVKQVKFVDRTFNVWHTHAMAIWQYIFNHDNGVTNFHFEIAADLLTEAEITLLQQMRPGLVQLEIGIQSTNRQTIKEICRTMDIGKVSQVVKEIHKNRNIHVHLDLIAGLPYEDYGSFCQSFNDVYAMEPDQLQLGFLKVLSGTDMLSKTAEYGLVFHDTPPYEVLFTDWLSYQDIILLKGVEEMVEIYYNSAQFSASIKRLQAYFKTPFAMYYALAEFYRDQGFEEKKQNRLENYNLLRIFAEKVMPETEYGKFVECLVYDLYVRENRKSRPEFAKSIEPYKKIIKAFYQTEAKERYYLPDYQGFDGKQLARMTHLEHFSCHPLTEEKQEIFLLFDYNKRNPLSYDAAVIELRKGDLYAFTNHIEEKG